MPDQTEEQQKEFDQRLDKIAKDMLNEREQTGQVYNFLLDRQMTQVLKDKTSVNVKKVDSDEFIKEVQKADESAKKSDKK